MTWIHHGTEELDRISTHPTVIGVTLAFGVLMLAVVITRGVYRRNILGWDDYIIFITATMNVIYTIMAIVQTRWGLALPVDLRPVEDIHTQKLLSYGGKPWYTASLAGYKVALCIGYLRFIDGACMPWYRRAIIAVAVLSVVMQITFVLVNFLSCMPVQYSWDDSIEGSCLPWYPVQYSMAAFQIVNDVVVWLLPIPLFLKLSINRRIALGLSILFALGLTTTIAAIVRATYLKQVGPDGKGSNTLVVVLGCVEVDLGIMMACLPFLRGLVKGVFNIRRNSGGRRHKDSPQHNHNQGMNQRPFGAYANAKAYANSEKRELPSRSESEEAIMSHEQEDDGMSESQLQGIVKTTQVQVKQERIGAPF